MDLSIVIVSWNVKDKLRECLKSVEETCPSIAPHPNPLPQGEREIVRREEATNNPSPATGRGQGEGLSCEVFVVDNASKDGTVVMLEKEFPSVHLIANNFNAGFAKANNQAIRLSQGRYVLLLNPDMRVFLETLVAMVKFMDDPVNARVGVAGCHLVSPSPVPHPNPLPHGEREFAQSDGIKTIPSLATGRGQGEGDDYTTVLHVRRFPGFVDQLAIMLKVPHLFPRVLDSYMMPNFDYGKEARVDSIRGSFFMIRREVLNKIGMLDEGFFIWFEEVDFCKRAMEAGYEIAYTPSVHAVDYVGQSFKQVKFYPKQKMFTRSMVYYFKKHAPFWQYRLLWAMRPVALAVAWVKDCICSNAIFT